MFKYPNPAFVVPYDQLELEFRNTRPLPLPCLALSPEAKLPTKENDDDFGWDLYPDHVVTVGTDTVAVDTGLAVAIPPGYGALLKERSGLARKHGVKVVGVRLVHGPDVWEDVSGGVIDAGYRGPLIVLLAIKSGFPPRTFSPADKVCQLVILPAPKFVPFWTDELPPSSRGTSGFGDSGGVGAALEPKPSPEPLGASVSVPEPESGRSTVKAQSPLLEAPREPNGLNSFPPRIAPRSDSVWSEFRLRSLSDRPLQRAYKVWLNNGGPAAHSAEVTDEMRKRLRDAVEAPIDIEPLVREYQDKLYAKALERVGEVVQGSVSINGVKVPISSAVIYESGHVKTIIEACDGPDVEPEECTTVHT